MDLGDKALILALHVPVTCSTFTVQSVRLGVIPGFIFFSKCRNYADAGASVSTNTLVYFIKKAQ